MRYSEGQQDPEYRIQREPGQRKELLRERMPALQRELPSRAGVREVYVSPRGRVCDIGSWEEAV